jgi:hypothetical protein
MGHKNEWGGLKLSMRLIRFRSGRVTTIDFQGVGLIRLDIFNSLCASKYLNSFLLFSFFVSFLSLWFEWKRISKKNKFVMAIRRVQSTCLATSFHSAILPYCLWMYWAYWLINGAYQQGAWTFPINFWLMLKLMVSLRP